MTSIIDGLEELGRRIVKALNNKRGSWGLPPSEGEAIALALMPDIIAFFETEEGKQIYEQWKREQEEKKGKNDVGCDKKTVRKEWIEDLVVEQIKRLVHDEETVNTLADLVMDLQGRANTTLPSLQQQLAEINTGIDNLVNAIQMGICNDATKKRMDELEARKAEIEVQIAKEEIAKPKLTRDQVCCYLHHFRTFDTNNFEHRRRFIDTFINRIFLYDDKIVITFNYQNGTKTVTFAELEVSGILSELAENGEPKKALAFQQVLFCFSLNPQLRNPSNLLTASLFFCYNNCRMVK